MLRELDKQIKISDIIDTKDYGPFFNHIKIGERILEARFTPDPNMSHFLLDKEKFQEFMKKNSYDFQYIQGHAHFFDYKSGKFDPNFYKEAGERYLCNELKILIILNYNSVFYNEVDATAYFDISYKFDEEYKHRLDLFFLELQACLKTTSNTPKINIVTRSIEGYKLYEKEISEYEISILDNYNDDFKDIYERILTRLETNNDKGLVLLHGIPGTGKTTFIRHICGKIKDKKIIYIPSDMAAAMTDPAFLTFLIQYSNSILIIEDAEELLRNRAQMNRTNAISNLLNMSDGLLSDVLNIQILCTFNCSISDIDPALLRKGRIIAKYEFKELCLEKTKKLLPSAIQPMTLADIYNHEDGDFQNNKKSTIGFGLQSVA